MTPKFHPCGKCGYLRECVKETDVRPTGWICRPCQRRLKMRRRAYNRRQEEGI